MRIKAPFQARYFNIGGKTLFIIRRESVIMRAVCRLPEGKPFPGGEKTERGNRKMKKWMCLLLVALLTLSLPALAEEAEKPSAEGGSAAESRAEAGENASEFRDFQYVLYLGTNDKDTNTPVFTEFQAMEKAQEILLRRFGGYTIQEARGGWIDEGTAYQEYTLVIYLSDTTLDKVHEAAAELLETFHQSSILIQQNPTRTEFYSGEPSAD